MKAFNGAVWRQILTAQAFIGGAWRTLTVAKSFSGGTWRTAALFVSPLSVSIAPNPCNTGGSYYVNSRAMTATPTGGLGPFTYLWTVVSSSQTVTIQSPTLATTTVSGSVAYSDTIFTLSCVATDSLGSTIGAQVDGALFDNTRNIGGGRYL